MPLSATLLALLSVVIWSFLAYLGANLTHVPPLLVVGLALCISGLVSAVRIRDWRVPLVTLAVGVGGIFGYHFLYFASFRYAPPVEASLMNYMWPLLIVLLSPVYLRGYNLRPHHLIGALIGLSGAALIISGGRLSLDMAHLRGYILAAGAAFVWASYSLLTKRVPPFPTGTVGLFCLVSGIFSLGAFSLSSDPFQIANLTGKDWLLIALTGAGPLGAAFFTWDAALKRGDPRIIGSLAYLTPLSSTLVLVLVDGQHINWVSGLAMVLIISGAVIGSLDLWLKPTPQPLEEHAK